MSSSFRGGIILTVGWVLVTDGSGQRQEIIVARS
jgi:hypothetical protein